MYGRDQVESCRVKTDEHQRCFSSPVDNAVEEISKMLHNPRLSFMSSRDKFRKTLRNLSPLKISLLLILSLVSSNLRISTAQANSTPTAFRTSPKNFAQFIERGATFLNDGTYIYGQSPERDQIGQAYMVFEVNQGRVLGAFYMPHSSFDCFSGVAEGNQLALSVVDSYTQEAHPFSLGLYTPSAITASAYPGADQQNITIEGFHPIQAVNQNEHRMLEICKADLN